MKKNYFYFLFLIALCSKTFAQLPAVSNIMGSSAACSDQSGAQTYSVLSTNSPVFYTWNVTPSGGVVISNPTGSVTSISFPPNNGSYNVECYATNNFGDGPSKSITVNVGKNPLVSFSGAVMFCQGSSTNLSASPTIFSAIYNWSPSTGLNTTSGPYVVASPNTTTTYTVFASNGPCNITKTVTIIIINPCNTGLQPTGNTRDNELMVYPNPNNGAFTLQSLNPGQVTIVNELGQLIRTVDLKPEYETKITDLPPGIYFIISPDSRKKIVVTRN